MTASRRLQLAAVRNDRHSAPPLALADRWVGFRAADGRDDTLARLRTAVESPARSERRPCAMAC